MGKPRNQRPPRTHRDLVARIEAEGATITQRPNGHLRATLPDGRYMTLALTPSDNARGALNSWRNWRRLAEGREPGVSQVEQSCLK